jgi:hypothetical protein
MNSLSENVGCIRYLAWLIIQLFETLHQLVPIHSREPDIEQDMSGFLTDQDCRWWYVEFDDFLEKPLDTARLETLLQSR